MRSLRGLLTCSLLVLLLAGHQAVAATAAAPQAGGRQSAAAAASATTEAIGTAEIPMRSDIDERFVQELTTRAQQSDPADKLAPPLDQIAAGVRKLSETFKRDELWSLPVTRLESLERHWNFYEDALADWRSSLQQVTTRYSEDAAELARRKAVWEATRTAAESRGLTPALLERVNALLAEIATAEQALSGPLENQLKLARRANSVQQAVDSGKKSVDAAIKYFDRRLGMIDAPPLWEAWSVPAATDQSLSTLRTGLQIESDFLAEYNARYAGRLRLLHFSALALLPLLLWLSRRSRKLVSDDPALEASARVLLRPVSSWLMLVFLGVLFFEPNAPMIRHQAALLLALIPVLRLLPDRVYRLLGPWPYIVTGLYLFDQLGFLVAAAPLLQRLHLLAVEVVTIVTLLWLLIRGRSRGSDPAQFKYVALIRAAGWLGLAGLVVAVIANVVGNVSLAEVLNGAILDSGYIGLAFYAGATVLNAVLRLLLARRGITRFRVVTTHTGPLLQFLARLVNLTALGSWVVVVLNEFRVYRPVARWADSVLTHPLEVGELSITLGSVLLFFASVWVAMWLARTIRVLLRDEVMPKVDLPRGVGNSVSTLTYYGVLLLGFLAALAAAGFRVSQLAFVVGALGVGIGFGLQNVVNNFVSGLILMFERPIQPGDVIEVSGTAGTVRDIGMRATTLATFEGAEAVVPNGTLLSEKLINWTLSDTSRRLDVNVGVAYGTDPRKVLALLEEVAKSTPRVTTDPAPAVIFSGFGPSSLDFAVRAWTHDFSDWVVIRSDLTMRIYEALSAAGITIPFPQHELHVRSVSKEVRDQLATLRPPEGG